MISLSIAEISRALSDMGPRIKEDIIPFLKSINWANVCVQDREHLIDIVIRLRAEAIFLRFEDFDKHDQFRYVLRDMACKIATSELRHDGEFRYYFDQFSHDIDLM